MMLSEKKNIGTSEVFKELQYQRYEDGMPYTIKFKTESDYNEYMKIEAQLLALGKKMFPEKYENL